MMLAPLLLAGCGGEKDADYVVRKLDIVLPRSAAVTSGDSHGGFYGDGLLHMELTLSQEDILAMEEAAPSVRWSLSPTGPELEERLYPDGAGASDWPDWPVPARGWQYLEDRQEDETEDMWQWHSYNYTFAVYDPDTGTLYYQELDTWDRRDVGMDDLSTLGPLALDLLAWVLGLAALMTRQTGLCAPSLGCCAATLVFGTLALNVVAWLRIRYKE